MAANQNDCYVCLVGEEILNKTSLLNYWTDSLTGFLLNDPCKKLSCKALYILYI